MTPPVITTRRLTLRPVMLDDVDAITDAMGHWDVVRQLGGWPWPADATFTQSRCKPYAGTGFGWGICLDGDLCGSVAVTQGELGYVLHPDMAGFGIMTQAAGAAVRHAFTNYDFDQLNAASWADNSASQAVLGKLGFRHWQTLYEHARARRMPTLSHHFRMMRADWMA